MKRIRWLLAMLLVSRVCAQGEDVSPELEVVVGKTQVPGLVVAVIQDGRILAQGAAGVRRAGEVARITVNDRIHLGSCTKSMTATLAAMLVKSGKIRWETPVTEVFPDLPIHPGYRGTTLIQLLSNQGGVPGNVPAVLWASIYGHPEIPENEQRMRLVRTTLEQEPAHAPGTTYEYSNTGFTIAGAMLERVSGQPYDALLRQQLFTPLGITTGGFGAPIALGDQPAGHVLENGHPQAIPAGPRDDNPSAITPAGRVHLSILDFARYAAFHLDPGTQTSLRQEDLDQLHTVKSPTGHYALGWQVVERNWAGGKALTHQGTNTQNFAVMWLAPAKHFAVVAACNIDSKIGSSACDQAVERMILRYLKP